MITCDIEASALLDDSSIDYTSVPYRLKDNYKMHCIVVEDHDTGALVAFYDGPTYILDGRVYEEEIEGHKFVLKEYDKVEYEHKQLNEFPGYIENHPDSIVVGHNFIEFDILALKLFFGMDYSIKHNTWGGRPFEVKDTLVMSKCLNPDRFGGHSLENLGKKVNYHKIDFRKEHPKDVRFMYFAADMLYYCIRDVQVNTKVYYYLENEAGDWDWELPLWIEKRTKDIITRGSHRGFKFDKVLAEKSVAELDRLLAERSDRVSPLIPAKPATKKFLNDMTPPKRQFKDGGANYSAFIEKFVDKHNGTIERISDTGVAAEDYKLTLFGKEYTLPLPDEPLVTTEVASIDDTTHIKNWLVGMEWEPSEFKEKDLTYRQVKGIGKVKRNYEQYVKAVDNYVEQTLASNFCKKRCEFLKVKPDQLRNFLLGKDITKGVKVLTNPNFTFGQDKEICPNLEKIVEDFPYAKDIIEYLTYKHRRNSILGGGLDWDEEEEAEKGYLAYIRADDRIPTPADSCGAATSRFKHRIVANIPRITSLYGEPMRGLFGVGDECYQVGYDFASLEARIEAHYCWKYDKTKEYCNSLLLEKPNDVHSRTAKVIGEILKREFPRSTAKNVKYGCTYGATAPKVAKTIGASLAVGTQVFDAFWVAAAPLKRLKDKLKAYWESTGKRHIIGIDGRKVPTRAAHAILNSLFQSAGVICAKYAMIMYEDMLEEAGLLVDFFKDDWTNKDYVQQLIAYHDECQSETPKTSMKFKKFASKEIALSFREEEKTKGRVWSEVVETDKGIYLAYCKAGDFVSKAVDKTTKFFKLNVPLAADYCIGRNWAECH